MTTNSFENSQSLQIQTIVDVVLPLTESMYRIITNSLPLVQLQSELLESLEVGAAELWNVCSSISTNHANTTYNIKLFCILLLSIYELLNPSIGRCLTNISCIITLYSNSITKDINDVMKKCNTYLEPMISKLVILDKDSPFDQRNQKLLNEYKEKLIMLNLNYAVITNDFVLAKSYAERILISSIKLVEPSFVFECCRVLYNSSLTKYQEEKHDEARFLVLIAIKYLEGISVESTRYRQRYLHCYILLVKIYKGIDTTDTKNQAKETLLVLQKSFPNSLDIYHIYLDICDSENIDGLEDMLMQMVTSVNLEEEFDKTINLLKLCVNKSFKGVNKCLDYLLTHFSKEQKFTETIVVTKFVTNILLCKNTESMEIISELSQFIQVIERTLQSQLSISAKSSIIAIVWSQGMKEYKLCNYKESIKWFELALSRLFYIEYSENQDRGKIIRAIQNNHFELGNYNEVISMVELMDREDKLAILTQFNIFRSYLMLGNTNKAMECICKLTEHDAPLAILTIAACILESKDKLAPSFIKTIFLKLVEYMCGFEFTEEYINKIQSHDIVFPACCRCAVVMYSNELENSDSIDIDLLSSLRELLQKSCEIATKLIDAKAKIFTINDLEWFASKSYNIGLSCYGKENLEPSSNVASDFCKISISFIDLITPEIEPSRYQQLLLWKTRANLLNIMFTCSSYDLNANEWNEIRTKCLELKEIILKQNHVTEIEWKECLQQVMIYHFQAELSVGSIQSLSTIVDDCTVFKNKITIEIFSIFVNLLMDTERTIANHTKKQILKQIIDKSFSYPQPALQSKLIITWVRHLFELCEQNYGDNEKSLLTNLYKLIKANQSEIIIPTFEIEWLATTCWNFGIVSLMYVKEHELQDKEGG